MKCMHAAMNSSVTRASAPGTSGKPQIRVCSYASCISDVHSYVMLADHRSQQAMFNTPYHWSFVACSAEVQTCQVLDTVQNVVVSAHLGAGSAKGWSSTVGYVVPVAPGSLDAHRWVDTVACQHHCHLYPCKRCEAEHTRTGNLQASHKLYHIVL